MSHVIHGWKKQKVSTLLRMQLLVPEAACARGLIFVMFHSHAHSLGQTCTNSQSEKESHTTHREDISEVLSMCIIFQSTPDNMTFVFLSSSHTEQYIACTILDLQQAPADTEESMPLYQRKKLAKGTLICYKVSVMFHVRHTKLKTLDDNTGVTYNMHSIISSIT